MRRFSNRHRTNSNSSYKSEEHCVYTPAEPKKILKTVYKSVSKFLSNACEQPQRMSVSSEQQKNKNVVIICIDEISKEEAIEMVESKHFEAAFEAADNRKAIKKGCNQAKIFFREHVIQRNPFPPRQRFPLTMTKYNELKELKKKQQNLKKEAQKTSSHHHEEGRYSDRGGMCINLFRSFL